MRIIVSPIKSSPLHDLHHFVYYHLNSSLYFVNLSPITQACNQCETKNWDIIYAIVLRKKLNAVLRVAYKKLKMEKTSIN